jgi:thioredoxin-related protein
LANIVTLLTLPTSISQRPSRRALLLACSAALAWPAGAQPKESALPTPASFPQAARDAAQKGEPLLVLVSLPGCPWCELLRRNYLTPMRAEGVQVVQFTVNDKSQRFEGFSAPVAAGAAGASGAQTASLGITGVDMSSAYKARLTPTLLFLDTKGIEIAERITGVASVDFIGAQIEQRLAVARLVVKGANK